MSKKLFQNDSITGNSLIGFEIRGTFKKEEDELLLLLSPVLNREILYSNIEYKLLEPTDRNAILIKDGDEYIIKTPLYNYFEAIYIMPKLFECLHSNLDKNEHNYVYLKGSSYYTLLCNPLFLCKNMSSSMSVPSCTIDDVLVFHFIHSL